MINSIVWVITGLSLIFSVGSYSRKPKNYNYYETKTELIETIVKEIPIEKKCETTREIHHEFVLTEENAKQIAAHVVAPPQKVEIIEREVVSILPPLKKSIDELWWENRDQIKKEYGLVRRIINNVTYYALFVAPGWAAKLMFEDPALAAEWKWVIGVGFMTGFRDLIAWSINYVIDYPEIYKRTYEETIWDRIGITLKRWGTTCFSWVSPKKKEAADEKEEEPKSKKSPDDLIGKEFGEGLRMILGMDPAVAEINAAIFVEGA